ncbi:MAG TPA: class I SAM-dependent methyltransferase [Rhodopila sp.]|uniref:class I SAM-dependent methyltransferase n=1 Tax=Rhodopila sp. TaxID=2480087 RepID=UPI002C889BBD|nr:class I SAM-dependent methyltransferase [Rhodopila sp.]HVY14688.1 class I SAM-dependent methyltransferase [Rhodopila sp.]
MIRNALRAMSLAVPAIKRLSDQRDSLLREVEALKAEKASAPRQTAEMRSRTPAPSRSNDSAAIARSDVEAIVAHAIEAAKQDIRSEYTSLPRFAYHLPFDYEMQTMPPVFDEPVRVDGEPLPLPPVAERHGSTTTDQDYLDWGRYERDIILGYARDVLPSMERISIMDFGCSSGRILRHFYPEVKENQWQVTGVDVSARRIEWMRRNFPPEFQVYTGSFLPVMPFEDNTFDIIYGMSVFTHIKYLWDLWLLELRRILKPGGVLIQSVHTEHAWDYFVDHADDPAVRDSLGPMIINHKQMPADFVYYGDLDKNQVFWKKDIVVEFWGRYFDDVKVYPPPERYSYQNWVVARKP